MQVRVRFDVTRPGTHLVRVTLTVPPSPAAKRTFRMPAWVPGSYKIRDYGRHVQDLAVLVGGRKVEARQDTKDAWTVKGTGGKPVELTYDVYCRELTVDTSHVTQDHAHLFPATLVMYDAESRHLPHAVVLAKPADWHVWSGLESPRLAGDLETAADFDHLIDCPIEVGPPEDYHVSRFRVRGVAHRLVVWRPPVGVDWARITRDVAAVCREAVKVWGDVPYRHYTFLGHVAGHYGGGLEHRNSTVLGIDPLHLTTPEKVETRFIPLVAHEFFHTWNVKRILPKAFQPYDLQQEVYTDLLWLFEGFTSFYELPLLYRAKVCSDEAFGKMAAEFVELYEKATGRKRISVAKSSRLTWTLLYQPHEHNVNRHVSYYTKGMWVALALDAELRRRGVRDGLDAVMRHIWRRHGRTGEGVPEGAFPALVKEATGVDVSGKLKAWIDGTADPPIEPALRYLGWTLKRDWKDPKRRHGLGIEFKPHTSTIARIWDDMPAFTLLEPDDEMVAYDGWKWDTERFHDHVATRKKGDAVEVAVYREGRLRSLKVPLVELPKTKITIARRKGDAAATRRRKAWIGEGRKEPKDKKA